MEPNKKATFYLSPKDIENLNKLAKFERRSKSNMVSVLIDQAVSNIPELAGSHA